MFNKFLHIENASNFKDGYVMLEKIDGANIQFIFENGELVGVASRNQLVEEDYDFNSYKKVIQQPEFVELFDRLKKISIEKPVNLYGEIYSNNIQKNIHYGEHTNIKFFALQLNSNYVGFIAFKQIIANDNLIVPVVGHYGSIEEALKFDVNNFKSIVANNDEIAEGVIIEPINYWDSRRIVKFKSDKFKEIKPVKKQTTSPEVKNLQCMFQDGYLTENRLKNVISHYDLSNIDNILKYKIVNEFVKDAKEDFIKNEDLLNFDKKDLKKIFDFDFKEQLEKLNNILIFKEE